MKITPTTALSLVQTAQIAALWDAEFPHTLQHKFYALLESARAWQHFIVEADGQVLAWGGIFTQNNDTRFSLLVATQDQGKGLGKQLIAQMRQYAGELEGWVVDQADVRKQDGSLYPSPLTFYQKLGFEVLPAQRFDTEQLRSVRVRLKAQVFAETERFVLREILPSDEAGMFELDADPEVHRYLGNKPVTDRAQIREVISFIRQQYVQHGIGRWAVVDKHTGEFVGWSGLKFVTEPLNGHQNFYDLGYRLQRKHWGKGIGRETAAAALAYGFEQLNLAEIFAAAACDNVASNSILRGLGFQPSGTFLYDDLKCHWYSHKRSDFKLVGA